MSDVDRPADSKFERRLRAMNRAEVPARWEEELLPAGAGSVARFSRPPLWVWAMAAVAAVALIAIALFSRRAPSSQPDKMPAVTMTITIPPTQGEWKILAAVPKHEIIVQDLDSLNINAVKTGESLGRFTVKAVEADAVEMEDSSGRSRVLIADWNRNAEKALGRELAAFKDASQAHILDAASLPRLGLLASAGSLEALALLEQIAQQDTALRAAAVQCLTATGHERALRQLIEMSRTAAGETRVSALRGLGSIASPLALQCLFEHAMSMDSDMAPRAVRALSEQDPRFALPLLWEIVRSAPEPGARKVARELHAKLIYKLFDAEHHGD